ncbi:hypothetical protein WN943_003247 [Citrus x changshan-huyou]
MAWKEEEAETEALDELAEPLIYQINSYKFLKSSIDKASKKLKTIKIENLDKISTKTIVRSKTSRKECSHDLSLFRFEFDDIVTLVQFEGKVKPHKLASKQAVVAVFIPMPATVRVYQPLVVTVSHFLCTQIVDLRGESSSGGQSKAVIDCLKEPSSLALPKHREGWRLNSLKPIEFTNGSKPNTQTRFLNSQFSKATYPKN